MAFFETDTERHLQQIEAAREAVRSAQLARQRGNGSVEACNRADRKLADANDDWYQFRGGSIPTNLRK